jgi:hydrogenase expression/formation protein HypD
MSNYKLDSIMGKIQRINCTDKKVNIMEVCGTHTYSISKFGIREALNHNVDLISGPGCPVCVTPDIYIDHIYNMAMEKDIIIATYGDMIRVPGSGSDITLEKAKARGAEVRMVYSSVDAVHIALENPSKKVVFLGIGFETTAPATAIAIKEAMKLQINNFYIMSMHKIVEPVMRTILNDKEVKIDGFLCPGHVAVVIGEKGFRFLEGYNCPSAIAGFDLNEVIDGIYSIVMDIENKDFRLKNVYRTLVREMGNLAAQKLIDEFFIVSDDYWRGIDIIKNSGLKLKREFKKYDAETLYPIDFTKSKGKSSGCKCGEVLKGKIKPKECSLFGKVCTPDNPIGPCMVSGEGSCSAYYKFNRL